MDLHICLLANAIKPANTLLQQVRAKGQVKQDKVAGKLKVTAFTADLGAQQQLRATIGFRKIVGGPVSGDKVHAFMKYACAHRQGCREPLLQVYDCLLVGADQQELVVRMTVQQGAQPGDARVAAGPAGPVELGEIAESRRRAWTCTEGIRQGKTLRKAFYGGADIPKQHSPPYRVDP